MSLKIEKVMVFPDGSEGLGDVEIAKANRVEGGDIELQVIARREGNFFSYICRFKNQFFDKSGDVAIADHAELIGFLRPGTHTTGTGNVDQESTVTFLDGIRDEAAANRSARGRAIDQVEAPVVLGTLDHLSFDQALGEVSVAVGA